MSAQHDIVDLIRAIVRSELAATHVAELAVVTQTYPHAAGGDKHNYACDVKLRDSGLELKGVPVATQRIGQAAMPNVDDLVLLNFVRGDVHGAVITARLYNDVDRPPVAKDKEWVYVSVDDAQSGVRRAHFEFPNGNKATLDDDKFVLEMGATRLSIKNGGDVELASAAKISISCDGDMALKAGGSISVEAGGSLALKAGSDATLDGMAVTVKAQTSAELKGGAAVSLKGPLISVGGNISFSPS